MLARLIERAGIPTVVVTMMPDLAAWVLAPRIVGVEFPFGHSFGTPGDDRMHRRVLSTAMTVLAGAPVSGTRVDIDAPWPVSRGEAYKSWQPSVPSPIVQLMLDRQKQS